MNSIFDAVWVVLEYTGWLLFAVVVTAVGLRHLLRVTKPFVDLLTKKNK